MIKKNYLLTFAIFLFLINSLVSQELSDRGRSFSEQNLAKLWGNESFGSYSEESEIKEKRDETSKQFRTERGSVIAFLSTGRINYLEHGEWKTIFHTIEETSTGFQNIHNSFKTYYPATSKGNITTILKDGGKIRDMLQMRMFYQKGNQEINIKTISNKQGIISKNELQYNGVYGIGIDLKLTQQTNHRKMDYIIQNREALGNIPSGSQYLIFEEKVELPNGWTATLENNEIIIKDKNGKIQAYYQKPVFHDTPQLHKHTNKAHENEVLNEITGEYKLIGKKGLITIQTKVPTTWLNNSSLNFPLTIDPTVTCYAENQPAYTGFIRVTNSYTTGSIYEYATGLFRVGKNWISNSNRVSNAWAKFNITSIPDNSCVESAVLKYKVEYNYSGDSDCRVHCHLRHMANDPASAYTAGNYSSIVEDIKDGAIFGTFNLAVNSSASSPTRTLQLMNVNYITQQLVANWFAVGFDTYASPGNGHDDCFNRIYGMNNADRPSLEVEYFASNPAFNITVDLDKQILCVGETTNATVQLPPSHGNCNYTTTYNGTNAQTVFRASDVFENNTGSTITVHAFLVGGGGGGGRRHAGGGGAGGVIENTSFSVPNGNHSVIIGTGGNGGISGDGNVGSKGGNGGDTKFLTLTAIGGGGGGGNENGPGNSGGSGGGGSNLTAGGAGTAGQGYAGGGITANIGFGAGGGGAGGAAASSSTEGTKGGVGIDRSSVFGTAVGDQGWFAGGGGGGRNNSTAGYEGGKGGGGKGGNSSSLTGTNGKPNTGGGGGGGGANGSASASNNGSGGWGGSGIAIFKHKAGIWKSSNPSVASVDPQTGLVTALSAGYSEISYTTTYGSTNSKTVVVNAVSTASSSISGGGNYCHGNTIVLTPNGGNNGTGVSHVWYKDGCNNIFTEDFLKLDYGITNTSITSHINGIISLKSTTWDPMIHMNDIGPFNADVYKYINVRYRVISGPAGSIQIYFSKLAGNGGLDESKRVDGALNEDGNWHIVSINMGSNANWNGTITGWRFDWSAVNNAEVEFDFLQLSQFPMIDEDNTTPQLELTPSSPYYPTSSSPTTYASSKIDNCGQTVCVSTTVTLPSRLTTLGLNNESATCNVNAGETVHFYHSSGRYLASITANPTEGLGSTVVTNYTSNDTYANAILVNSCDNASFQTATLGRHWLINPTNNRAATVILPYYNQELTSIIGVSSTSSNPNDAVGGQNDLGLSKYSGPNNMNASWSDNCPSLGGNGGTTWQANNGYGEINSYISSWAVGAGKFSKFNITGFSEFWLHATGSVISPLAVEFSNFSTICQGSITTINWTTHNEINSDFFIIERSRNGYDWEVVDSVDAIGGENLTMHYTVNDTKSGEQYYRIKEVTKDGKIAIFGPIISNCEGNSNSTIFIYPNPNNGTFNVVVNSTLSMGETQLIIHDVTGKIVYIKDLFIENGYNSVQINQRNLETGAYFVSLLGADKLDLKPVKLVIH